MSIVRVVSSLTWNGKICESYSSSSSWVLKVSMCLPKKDAFSDRAKQQKVYWILIRGSDDYMLRKPWGRWCRSNPLSNNKFVLVSLRSLPSDLFRFFHLCWVARRQSGSSTKPPHCQCRCRYGLSPRMCFASPRLAPSPGNHYNQNQTHRNQQALMIWPIEMLVRQSLELSKKRSTPSQKWNSQE